MNLTRLLKVNLVVFVILVLFGCKSVQDVPKVRTQYITEYVTDTVNIKDSIYLKDSIYIYSRNDTVFQNKYKVLYKYKYKYLTNMKVDTIYKTDSIPYKVEIVKYVDHVNKIQQILIYIGLCALLILAFYLGKLFIRK